MAIIISLITVAQAVVSAVDERDEHHEEEEEDNNTLVLSLSKVEEPTKQWNENKIKVCWRFSKCLYLDNKN